MVTENTTRDLTILGLLALFAGLAVQPYLPSHDVQAPRAAGSASLTQHGQTNLERVESPLWEDPFSAVLRQIESDRKSPAAQISSDVFGVPSPLPLPAIVTLPEFKGQMCRDGASAPFVVLIPVDAGNHPSVVEARRRWRVALQEAMSARGALAYDDRHLGAIRYVRGSGPSSHAVLVPFERFEHAKAKGRHALAVWVDEDIFLPLDAKTQPLEALQQLAAELACHDRPGQVAIVGPPSSGQLGNMLRGNASHYPWATLHSPASTVEAETILGIPQATDADLALALRRQGLIFHRHIRTDSDLVRLLVDEVTARHAAIEESKGSNGCGIVLITEADSLYGRALPRQTPREGCTVLGPIGETSAYYFLKDINDPVASTQTRDKDSPGEGMTGAGARTTNTRAELAEGAHQFDYIRRLAAQIGSDQRAEDRAKDGLLAIGVFANESSDKVSLIRALRAHFPTATYFTTDLDASLWFQNNLKYTRNLLVASAYDLHPSDSPGPPFRDAYQTAYYAAFLSVIETEWLAEQSSAASLLEPRLFELGLAGPVELTRRAEHPKSAQALLVCGPWTFEALVGATGLFGALLASALLIGTAIRAGLTTWIFLDLAAWRRCRDAGGGSQRLGVLIRLLLTAGAGYVAVRAVLYAREALRASCRGDGEALELFVGVSMWGPTVLRFAALLLGFWFLTRFVGRTREMERRVGRMYGMRPYWVSKPSSSTAGSPSSWQDWVREQIRRMRRFVGNDMIPMLGSWLANVVYYITDRVSQLVSRLVSTPPGNPLSDAVDAFLRAAAAGNKRRQTVRAQFGLTDRSPGDTDSHPRQEVIDKRAFRGLWVFYERRSCLLPLDAALLAAVVVQVILMMFMILPDPSWPAREDNIAKLNYLLVRVAGGMMFAMAIAAALQLAQVRGLLRVFEAGQFWQLVGVGPRHPHLPALRYANDGEIVRKVLGTSEIWNAMIRSIEKQRFEKAVNRALQLMVIRDLTADSAWFVYAPFVLVTLLIVARWPLLDDHDFPLVLVLLFMAAVLFVVANALRLHRAAERARTHALISIREAKAYCGAGPGSGDVDQSGEGTQDRNGADGAVYWLDVLQNRVEALREGAFRPFLEQPALKAILIPLGGAGATQLVDLVRVFAE